MAKTLFILKFKVKTIHLNGHEYLPLKNKYTKADCINPPDLANPDLLSQYITLKVKETLDLNSDICYINKRPCFKIEKLPKCIKIIKKDELTEIELTVKQIKENKMTLTEAREKLELPGYEINPIFLSTDYKIFKKLQGKESECTILKSKSAMIVNLKNEHGFAGYFRVDKKSPLVTADLAQTKFILEQVQQVESEAS